MKDPSSVGIGTTMMDYMLDRAMHVELEKISLTVFSTIKRYGHVPQAWI